MIISIVISCPAFPALTGGTQNQQRQIDLESIQKLKLVCDGEEISFRVVFTESSHVLTSPGETGYVGTLAGPPQLGWVNAKKIAAEINKVLSFRPVWHQAALLH